MINLEHRQFLEKEIFNEDNERLKLLLRLDIAKCQLLDILRQQSDLKPFTAELSGTPRAGKTTCISSIHDFFKKGGFNVFLAEEIANLVNQRINDYQKLKNMSKEDYNNLIAEETLKIFKEKSSDRSLDIVLFDRGILDRLIWFYSLRHASPTGMNNLQQYRSIIEQEMIDFMCITLCDPITSMKREYLHSLTLEPRKNNNLEVLQQYNEAVKVNMPFFEQHTDELLVIETDHLTPDEVNSDVVKRMIKIFENKIRK